MKTIVIVSGFWDPVGIQHLALFNEAKNLGDYLIVGVNSDKCAYNKKKQPSFMPFDDRVIICKNLRMVDEVVGFEDTDGTACQLLQNIYDKYKEEVDNKDIKLIFANGGDRIPGDSTPEEKYVEKNLKDKITMKYGVGGFEKLSSSSTYLRNWVNNTMNRYNINFKLESKY